MATEKRHLSRHPELQRTTEAAIAAASARLQQRHAKTKAEREAIPPAPLYTVVDGQLVELKRRSNNG